jgi:hypothetical protein
VDVEGAPGGDAVHEDHVEGSLADQSFHVRGIGLLVERHLQLRVAMAQLPQRPGQLACSQAHVDSHDEFACQFPVGGAGSPLAARAAVMARRDAVVAISASARKARPATVAVTSLGVRVSSCTPRCFSKVPIRCDRKG